MSNVAKLTQTPSMPPRLDPSMNRTLDTMLSGSSRAGGILELLPGKELDDSERRVMEARLSTLRRSLAHRDRAASRTTLATFLASYGSVRGNESEAEMMLNAYLAVLADMPPWVVAEAAKAWTRGGYGAVASAFAPSAAQFHEVAANIVGPFRAEECRLEAVLFARTTPISAAERARVAAGFDALVSKYRNQPTEAEKSVSAWQRFEAMCAEAGVDPNSIRDAPPRDGFRKLSADYPELSTPTGA
jgi:hypothetical protein